MFFNDYKEPISVGSGSEKYDLNVLSLLNYYPFGMSMPGMGYENKKITKKQYDNAVDNLKTLDNDGFKTTEKESLKKEDD